jgi:hypothetical protein
MDSLPLTFADVEIMGEAREIVRMLYNQLVDAVSPAMPVIQVPGLLYSNAVLTPQPGGSLRVSLVIPDCINEEAVIDSGSWRIRRCQGCATAGDEAKRRARYN